MLGLTKFVLKRPVTTALAVLCIIVFGISSVFSSKLELMSDIEMPMLIVSAVYAGASPDDVEELVIKPIEDEIGTLSGVDSITSMSSENYGLVLLQYDYGQDIDQAYDDLKKKIDGLAGDLPDDVDTPTIIEMDINSMASLTLAVNNDSVENLYNYVDTTIVPEIEKLACVANVDVAGGREQYIRVELIPEKLDQYHLTMSAIASSIGTADFSMPIGSTIVGGKELSVTSGADFDTVELLKQIPITLGNGNIIYMEDVANIYSALEDQDSIGRYDGSDTISIGVKKNQDSTDIEVSDEVMKVMDALQAEDPALEVVVIDDNSDSIRSSLSSVMETMVMAVVISMAIIFIFFGDIKASLIVGTSIPISILTTLVAMWLMGFSLNVITLGALVLGVGMMVDNSIVVLESCFRAADGKGKGFVETREAALEGTKIVIESVIGSTLTTCVVFLPLAFMQGISGQMFKPLGFTIVFCMVASLISATTIVPLCYTFYLPREKTDIPANRALEAVKNGYRGLMKRLLKHKAAVMLTSVVLLILSLLLATQIDMVLMPSDDPGIIEITIETQPGLTIENTDQILRRAEAYVEADEDVDDYLLSYGSSGLSMSYGSSSGATLTAYLKDDRARSTDQVIKDWKHEMQGWSDATFSFEAQSSMSSMTMQASDELEFILVSTQYDELKQVSDEIAQKLREQPETANVHSSLENDAPLVKITVDPVKAAAEGYTPSQVAGQIYMMVSGTEATTINVDGNDLSVRVEYPDGEYDSIDKLQSIVLPTAAGGHVALMDIAEIGFKDSPQNIIKSDKQYQVTISGNLRATDGVQTDAKAAAALKQKYQKEIVDPYLSASISMKENSMTEMMNEEFSSLGTAIAIAIFLVFVVMAAQFESPKFSIMVMTTIPFSLIGSFGLLWLADSPISMPSLLGFLMLVGTVVNNGILYVDTVNQYRSDMDLTTALIEAGATRLRPILMTTLTTVVSMVPMAMAYGDSGEMMQGLALVDVGGLTASTVLALLMLPIYYSVMTRQKKETDYE